MKSLPRFLVLATLFVLLAPSARAAPPTQPGATDPEAIAGKAVSKILPTSLDVRVWDEGAMPPASLAGAAPVARMPLELRTLTGVLVAEAKTTETGFASLVAEPGEYVLLRGGPLPDASALPRVPLMAMPVRLHRGRNSLTLIVPRSTAHSHDELDPFEFDYLDLDANTPGLQRVITVDRGSTATVEIAWWELSTANWPVWFVSLFGSWQPTQALANVKRGVGSPQANNRYIERAAFLAPDRQGAYRLRAVSVLDYTWPPSFYTGHHYSPVMGRDMNVRALGKSNGVDWAEATLLVR